MIDEHKDKTTEQLHDIIDAIERENFDLIAKCVALLDTIGWDPNNTFTFPDGDVWNKFNPTEDAP